MTTKPRQGTRGRHPIVPDHELWSELARRIRPLRPTPRQAAEIEEPPQAARPGPRPEAKPPSHPRLPLLPGRPRSPESPPLTGIDRRMRRRLIRGEADIDDRIDLHGQTIESARVSLKRFLAEARSQGHRLVLVITGKGESPFTRHTLHGTSHFHSPERHGRLRRLVDEWLREPEFRLHVSGFQPAHPRHGGGGALYVRLRRQKDHPR